MRTIILLALFALTGCVHPVPVRVDPSPTAWFVVDGEVWHCDAAAKVLCRRFGVATPPEGK